MNVRVRYHAGHEHCFQILGRVGLARSNRDWPYLGNACAPGRCAPPGIFDCEKPNLAERFNDSTARPFGGFGLTATRVSVELPERLCVRELTNGLVGHNPAAKLPGSLCYRKATGPRKLCRRRV